MSRDTNRDPELAEQERIQRLEEQVLLLRNVLEAEREAVARDMAVGAAELAELDKRVARMQKRIHNLKARVHNLRRRAEQSGRQVVALEEELARYRGSRAVRLAVRVFARPRPTKDGT